MLAGLMAGAASLTAFGHAVWVEAEDFAEKGDRLVDTQFTHMMGSACVLEGCVDGRWVEFATESSSWRKKRDEGDE